MGFLDKLLGSTSEAQVKKLMPMVKRIRSFGPRQMNSGRA